MTESEEQSDDSLDFWEANARGRARWWDKFEESFQVLSDRMIDLAGIRSGDSVLDVGTGTGEPALSAARRVGPQGRVVATDISPAMLAVARKKSADFGLMDNLEFQVMDAQQLDFPVNTFDAVLCRLVLMFLPDANLALTNMRKLLRPDGALAAVVLGPAQQIPAITTWQGALAREREVSGAALHSARPVATDAIDPFRFSDPRELASALSKAGFQDVVTEFITTMHCFDSCEEFVSFQLDMDPPIQEEISMLGMSRLLQSVREALNPYLDADGRVHLPGRHNIVAGRAP